MPSIKEEGGGHTNVHTTGPNTRIKECDLAILRSLDTFASHTFLAAFRTKNKDEGSSTL